MNNKKGTSNVIRLISVNRFKHDGLSHITSLPFLKIEESEDEYPYLSLDVALNGNYENDVLIGKYCSKNAG
jgi:hypothetical protein